MRIHEKARDQKPVLYIVCLLYPTIDVNLMTDIIVLGGEGPGCMAVNEKNPCGSLRSASGGAPQEPMSLAGLELRVLQS